MRRQLRTFLTKLERDGIGRNGRAALVAHDDTVVGEGPEDLTGLGGNLLQKLDAVAVALVEPSLPFADRLIERAPAADRRLVPRDTESRTFLHDIPFIRRADRTADLPDRLAHLLGERKGVLVEGLGIIAVGAVTPEQAYVNVSSIFHSLFVTYLLDLIRLDGVAATEKRDTARLLREWLRPVAGPEFGLLPASALDSPSVIHAEMAKVGRMTVDFGLVDSFFGNISCRLGDTVFISQTAASLDALEGCIDPVPFDNTSTCGITASSELPAHRQVYRQTDAQTILHGHPRFAVIMSMLCSEAGCPIEDCWKDCPHVRHAGDIPIVAGEVGAGGLAGRIAPVIGGGRVIVYGHGVFAIGRNGFRDALQGLVDTERWCRDEYFRRLEAYG